MAMLEIRLNGKKEFVAPGNLAGLLNDRKVRTEAVTVEINNEIMPKERYNEYIVKPGDRIELIYPMGGGSNRIKYKIAAAFLVQRYLMKKALFMPFSGSKNS